MVPDLREVAAILEPTLDELLDAHLQQIERTNPRINAIVTLVPEIAHSMAQAADARLNVELESEGMTLNLGPQHPATHGVLRLVVDLDGGLVENLVVRYRNHECESGWELRVAEGVSRATGLQIDSRCVGPGDRFQAIAVLVDRFQAPAVFRHQFQLPA